MVTVGKGQNVLQLHDTLSIADGAKVQLYDAANKDYTAIFHASSQQLETDEVEKIILSEHGEVFLYGTYETNRRILEKDAIFTMGIGAIKELNEKQKQLESTVQTQQDQLTSVLARLAALEAASRPA